MEGQLISSLRRGVSVVGGLIDGFAPDASFSTLALLHLLCRWGTCAPKKGGMRSPDNKEAAIVVLHALLKEGIGTRPVVIELDAEEFGDGTSMWPLKPCSPCLVMDCKHGRSDLSPWHALVAEPLKCPEALLTWWEECSLSSVGGSITLASLLKRSIDVCPALHVQLVTQAALRVEEGIFLSLSPVKGYISPPIDCRYVTILDTMHSPNTLNAHLLRHVFAGVEASHRFMSLSLESDKASVCGLTLDAGHFIFPDNKCAVVGHTHLLFVFVVLVLCDDSYSCCFILCDDSYFFVIICYDIIMLYY